ncbi:MAG TPA: hypothetical protein VF181_02430 [Balneolaceae bacterium]
MKKSIYKGCLLAIIAAMIFQACSGTKVTSNDEERHIYAQPFIKMTEVVEEAVEGGGLHIERVFRSEDETEITLIVNTNAYLRGSNQTVQKDQGTVIITELANGKVQVEVKNPDYHYTVPRYMQKEYNRIIFNRINALLEKESNV